MSGTEHIRPLAGSRREKTTGWFVCGNHQWDSFAPGCNWRDFTLLKIGGEWSQMTGRVEVELCVLGLWLTVTYVYDDSFAREMMDRRDEFLSVPTPETSSHG